MLRKSRWPRSSDEWHARADGCFRPLLKKRYCIDEISMSDDVLLVFSLHLEDTSSITCEDINVQTRNQ